MDSAISAEPHQAPYEFVSPNGAVLTWVEGCTQHFAVVDKDRNVFATTGSILGSWGSGMVVPGYGFLLNNRMGYYHLIEGHPNELMPEEEDQADHPVGHRDEGREALHDSWHSGR